MALQNVTKIAIGWAISTVIGVYAFTCARRSVEEKRYHIMKTKRVQQDSDIAN